MSLMDTKAKAESVYATVNRVLNSRDGEVLMSFLEERYFDCPFKPTELERQVGRRDVVLILKTLKERKQDAKSVSL